MEICINIFLGENPTKIIYKKQLATKSFKTLPTMEISRKSYKLL